MLPIIRPIPAVLAVVLVTMGLVAAAPIKRQPGEVLLVYNSQSPTSKAIADDYAAKRGIQNVLAISCIDSAVSTDNETIPLTDYQKQIADPVSDYLKEHDWINFIVLTKGVPFRIEGGVTGSRDFHTTGNYHPSVDSYLAAIDYATIPGAVKIKIIGSGAEGYGWLNRYWNTDVPFTHKAFGGYLVTRLDGYTQADAMALVTRALAAERNPWSPPDGKVLLDRNPDHGLGDKFKQPYPETHDIPEEVFYGTWCSDLARADDIMEASRVPVMFDETKTYVGHQSDLIGYFSFGCNDPNFSDAAYQSLLFAPGSISDTAVSTSARTFLPTHGGQSLLEDLIAHGLTCGKGYCNEPLLQGIASPSVTLAHYLSGYTMAESFYAASRFVGWEDIVVGDPLCCPYAGNRITIPTQAAQFTHSSGVTTETCNEGGQDVSSTSGSWTEYDKVDLTDKTSFQARAASPQAGADIAVHLDTPTGPVIGTCSMPSTADAQTYADADCPIATTLGTHDIYLVAAPGLHLEWFAFRYPAIPRVETSSSP